MENLLKNWQKIRYNQKKKGLLAFPIKLESVCLFFVVHHKTISKVIEKHQPQRLDKMLRKYSKRSKSVRKI